MVMLCCCGRGGGGGEEEGGESSGFGSTHQLPSTEIVPPGSKVNRIKEASQFNDLLKEWGEGGKLVVADFYAPWCGPCQVVSPKVEALALGLSDKAVFAKINVDENDELCSTYGISCMPTFLIFLKGEKIDEFSGANIDKLKELIEKHSEKLG